MKKRFFAYPYVFWMVLFILLPLFLVIYYAFTSDSSGGIQFSLEHILEAFDPIYMNVLLRSIWIALICTVICLVLGYPVALFGHQRQTGAKADHLVHAAHVDQFSAAHICLDGVARRQRSHQPVSEHAWFRQR